MVPIKTSLDDIQKVISYMSRQVGWVETAKVEKALGSVDDRKLSAMVEFGLVLRDGGNIKIAPRGLLFSGGEQVAAMREVVDAVDLYRSTLEWVHYQKRSEVTATEIGQYWESSHSDTVGSLKGTTLKDGAVCFGRVIEGAGLGAFTIGRGGRETRVGFNLGEIERVVEGAAVQDETASDFAPTDSSVAESAVSQPRPSSASVGSQPAVTMSTSPNVHVNLEIHIAADATADTVREIFRNMALYVLDKRVDDDGS